MPAGSLTLGGIQYDIIANDKTKDGTESAKKSVDDLGVHYTDALTNATFNFNMITQAAQTMWGMVQQGFGETVGAAMGLADQLDNISDITGINVEELQRLKAAGVATGTSFESISSTLRMFSQRVADGGVAGENLRDKLKDLGVTVYDEKGNWKDANVIYWEAIEGLSKMPNEFERNARAMAIFGRSWGSIASLIKDYDKAATAASEADPFSEETIDRAHDYQIQIDILNSKFEKSKQAIGMELLPATREWVSLMDDAFGGNSLIFGWMDELNSFLILAARGFHIMGAEAQIAYQWLARDLEGANKTQQELNDWIQNKIRDDALRNAGYDTDGNGNVVITTDKDKLPQKYVDPAAGGKEAQQAEKDRISALVDAYKDYEAILKKVNNEKQKNMNMEQDYAENLQAAGNDVAQLRQLTMQHKRDERDYAQTSTAEYADAKLIETRYETIKAGKTPLSEIPGTSQYTEAQAKSGEGLSITIGTMNLSKDYPFEQMMKDIEAYLSTQRKQKGVRT